MRKSKFTKMLSVTLLLLFSFAIVPGIKVMAVPEDIVIDYLSLNDLHGTVDDSASSSNPGMARVATFIKGEMAKNPNTFLVSAGDQYQGSSISNLTYGDVVNDILKHLGMITSAVGNHEFDWGADHIVRWAKEGGFPFVASNIEVTDAAKPEGWDDHVKPYYVHEVTVGDETLKIGFIGIATPETSYKTAAAYVEGFTFTDPAAATNKWEKVLREDEGVDAVLALTHLGGFQNSEGVVSGEIVPYAEAVSVDGIFIGHTHQTVNGEVNCIKIVQGQYNGRSISKLSLTFEATAEGRVLSDITGTVTDLRAMKATLVEDPAVKAIIDEYYVRLKPILEQELGSIPVDLPHNTNDMEVTPMGQFVAKTMAEVGGTQIGIINGGGIRGGFEAGDITMGTMYSILPFDNALVTLNVSGAELKKLIDHGINSPDFRSGQFYGIEVWYDKTAPYKERVATIKLSDGTMVQDDEMYSVSTLDFIFTGGDKYDFSKAEDVVETYLPVRDLISEAIKEMEVIDFTFEQNLHELLRIDYLSLNDLHGTVDDKTSSSNPGMARVATFIKDRMAMNAHTYLVSAGDQYQGSSISNLTYGDVVNEILAHLGMLTSAVGNHEFDWGADHIVRWAKEGDFPFVASNIEVTDAAKPAEWDTYVKPYYIQEITVDEQTFKIGFIGIATPETAFKTAAEHVQGFTFTDPAEATNKWEKVLREEGVDVVLALTHLGAFQNEEGVISGEIVDYANKISVDGIFAGHTHQVVNGRVNDIPIVQGQYNGRSISLLSLNFDMTEEGYVYSHVTSEVFNLRNMKADLAEDPAVKAIIDEYYVVLGPILDEVIGSIEIDLPHNTDDMEVTPMGQFVAKTMAEVGGTQIGIINGGGIRGGFEAGDITMGTMYAILPFDNALVTLEVSGAELRQLIDHGINSPDFRSGQFYGIKVWYDEDAEYKERVTSMRLLDGTPIEDDVMYTVSTLDFIYTGGDKYDFSKAENVVETYLPVRDLITEAIREMEVIEFEFVENLFVGEDTTVDEPVEEEPVEEEPVEEEPVDEEEVEEEGPALPATGSLGTGAFYGLGILSLVAGAYVSKKSSKKSA